MGRKITDKEKNLARELAKRSQGVTRAELVKRLRVKHHRAVWILDTLPGLEKRQDRYADRRNRAVAFYWAPKGVHTQGRVGTHLPARAQKPKLKRKALAKA